MKVLFGEVSEGTVQVIERDDKYFIRYDAGAHQVVWREDEISRQDANAIVNNNKNVEDVLIELQAQLLSKGIKPYISNWDPSSDK